MSQSFVPPIDPDLGAATQGHRDVLRSVDLSEGGRIDVVQSARFVPDDVAIMLSQGDDFEDICGPHIGAVMSRVGWDGLQMPVTIAKAFDGAGNIVAAGWAMAIRWNKSRQCGINLSYAVLPSARGRGLAKQCAAAALLTFLDEDARRLQHAVNLQLRDRNTASARVALALGAELNPSGDFHVPSLDSFYLAFSAQAQEMIPRLQEILVGAARRERSENFEPINAATSSRERARS